MDFITHCRYQFLQDAVTSQKVHTQMTPTEIRHTVNQVYGVFAIESINEPELNFVLGLMHRTPQANGDAHGADTTTAEEDPSSPDDDGTSREKGG